MHLAAHRCPAFRPFLAYLGSEPYFNLNLVLHTCIFSIYNMNAVRIEDWEVCSNRIICYLLELCINGNIVVLVLDYVQTQNH